MTAYGLLRFSEYDLQRGLAVSVLTGFYLFLKVIPVLTDTANIGMSPGCCNGTLGYASNVGPLPCSAMECCDTEEIVAVVHVYEGLGFRFQCTRKDEIEPECYKSGMIVRSSNSDPDHLARVCCEGAKFKFEFHKLSAIEVSCTDITKG